MSFFTSLSGMRNAETDLRVISNNIANAESVGFKKSDAQFADLVARGSATDPRKTPGIGATVSRVAQDFALGQLEQTGRALDLAINGEGFFTTSDAISGVTSFTRNGNFELVSSGELQDAFGNPVLGFPVDACQCRLSHRFQGTDIHQVRTPCSHHCDRLTAIRR